MTIPNPFQVLVNKLLALRNKITTLVYRGRTQNLSAATQEGVRLKGIELERKAAEHLNKSDFRILDVDNRPKAKTDLSPSKIAELHQAFGFDPPSTTIATYKPGPRDGVVGVLHGITDGLHPEYDRSPNASPMLQSLEDDQTATDQWKHLAEPVIQATEEATMNQGRRARDNLQDKLDEATRNDLEKLKRDPIAFFEELFKDSPQLRETFPQADIDVIAEYVKNMTSTPNWIDDVLSVKSGEFAVAYPFVHAYGPRKTDFEGSMRRRLGLPPRELTEGEKLMLDAEGSMSLEEMVNKYGFLDTNGQTERDQAFLQHIKDHPELFVQQEDLDAARDAVQAMTGLPNELLEGSDGKARRRVIVIDSIPDIHVALRAQSLGFRALSQAINAGHTVIVGSSDACDTNSLADVIKHLEVCQEPIPKERAWVEMNQPQRRRKKRARAGRKQPREYPEKEEKIEPIKHRHPPF